MSRIAKILKLPRINTCWGKLRPTHQGWFAQGHDYSFVMAILEHMGQRRIHEIARHSQGHSERPAPQPLPTTEIAPRTQAWDRVALLPHRKRGGDPPRATVRRDSSSRSGNWSAQVSCVYGLTVSNIGPSAPRSSADSSCQRKQCESQQGGFLTHRWSRHQPHAASSRGPCKLATAISGFGAMP